MGVWLQQNGSNVEAALMSWTGLPSVAVITALPQQ
jgi:hypothetical protein